MSAFYPTPLVAQALLPVRLALCHPPCCSAGLCPALWGLPTLCVGKPGILALGHARILSHAAVRAAASRLAPSALL